LSVTPQPKSLVMPAVASTPAEIDLALSLLGLTRQVLENAIKLADPLVRNVQAGLHPRTYRGAVAWGETTKSLREEMRIAQIDWEEEGKTALPATVVIDGGASAMKSALGVSYDPHEPHGYQIVVAGGDRKTGALPARPGCANLKGHLMVRAVNANSGLASVRSHRVGNTSPKMDPQIVLDFGDKPAVDNTESGRIGTWIFLVRYGQDGIFAELSRPFSITKAGRIDDWSHRIVLGRIGSSEGMDIPMGSFSPTLDFGEFEMSDELNEDALPAG
jgi:hypothetical protein